MLFWNAAQWTAEPQLPDVRRNILYPFDSTATREDEGGCGICSRIRVTDIGNCYDRFNPAFITTALLAKVLSHPPSRITAET